MDDSKQNWIRTWWPVFVFILAGISGFLTSYYGLLNKVNALEANAQDYSSLSSTVSSQQIQISVQSQAITDIKDQLTNIEKKQDNQLNLLNTILLILRP